MFTYLFALWLFLSHSLCFLFSIYKVPRPASAAQHCFMACLARCLSICFLLYMTCESYSKMVIELKKKLYYLKNLGDVTC